MWSNDTTAEARRVQLEALRAMGPERRTELVGEMSEEVRAITLEGLRERHPGIGESELNLLLVELWHGRELAERVRAFVAERDR